MFENAKVYDSSTIFATNNILDYLHSDFMDEEKKLFVKTVPFHTSKNTITCLNCFSIFVCRQYKTFKPELLNEFENRKTPPYRKRAL